MTSGSPRTVKSFREVAYCSHVKSLWCQEQSTEKFSELLLRYHLLIVDRSLVVTINCERTF